MFRFAQHVTAIYTMCPGFRLIVLFLSLCVIDSVSAGTGREGMKVTLLGTGTPFPNAERFGSAILVEVAGTKLLFDCGCAVVIRLTQAGVSPKEVNALFLTHLHSDHVVGIPDLWLTGWIMGRKVPLRVWGPVGTKQMMSHLQQAYQFDTHMRRDVVEKIAAQGVFVLAKDIDQGLI